MVESSSVQQATVKGNTLVLSPSEYSTYASSITQESLTSQVTSAYKSAATNFLNSPLGRSYLFLIGPALAEMPASTFTNSADPFYTAGLGGTLYGQGLKAQGITTIISAFEVAIAEVSVVDIGGEIAEGGIAAVGATSASTLATRATTGAILSIGLGEGASYFTTGQPMSVEQTVISGTLGATTGIVLGGIGISGEQTPLEAAGATIYNVGKYGIVPMAAFSAGTAVVVGLIDPSVWSSSNLGSSSGNTKAQGQVSQSGQSETNSSNHPTVNYFSPNYLNFVISSTLSGAEFCGCITNEDRLYNTCIAVCIWTRRSTERQNKHKYNILLV
ncbi:MAG: hypothetical protein M1562_02230 [Candidatus Marsarchaeota archaeon]|nr:hypothetical protein [Candidatus Marsarchaeota archaeon]